MKNQSDIRFVRIRGRIVPIRRKQIEGSVKVATGVGVGVATATYSAQQIRKANFAFARSANLRGASKLAGKGSKTYADILRNASAFKHIGKKISRRGFGVLAVGAGVAGYLAADGAKDIFGKKNEKKVNATAAAVTAGTIALFAKKSKLSTILRIAKMSKLHPRKTVQDLYRSYSKEGMNKTASTVRKYASTKYKGFTPKPKSVYDGKQQDLFRDNSSNIKKWLRKK